MDPSRTIFSALYYRRKQVIMRTIDVLKSVICCGAFATSAHAQSVASTSSLENVGIKSNAEEASAIGFSNGGFVGAPIPLKNPTLGTGLALGGGYLFNLDEESANSFLGLGAFKTDNGSQGYGLSGDVAWDNNRWSLGMTVAEVDLFYNLYYGGDNRFTVPLRQDGKLINLTLQYGIDENIIVGLSTAYVESSIGLDGGGVLPGFLERDVDLKIYKFGPTFDLDYRDDTIYATEGYHVAFSGNYNQLETNLGTEDYLKGVIKYDAFTSLENGMVIATRAVGCSVSENTPFFEQCGLGSVDSFRGFSFGEVLDDNLLSFQAELRGRLTKRFGYALFAGLGAVADDFGNMSRDDIRTSAGLGLRFRLSEQFPMDFSVDYARADTGDGSVYIYVGQRF